MAAAMAAADPAPATPAATPVEQQFMAAMRRIRLHQPESADSAALQRFPIHDYLVAARLRRDLATGPGEPLDADIESFLVPRATLPVTRALRHEWLLSLAQRGRWDWFLPRSTEVKDPELLCARLAGRLALGDTADVESAALARWLLPQHQPPQCDPVFAWLRDRGVLTAALGEQRTRAALAAENPALAREFAHGLPANLADPLLQWAQLLDTPQPALVRLAAEPARTVEPDALLAGFTRLAYANVAEAATLLPALSERGGMTEALHARLQRALALGAAIEHSPGAIAAFDALPPDMLDTQALEWRVRAALWAKDYAKAGEWLAAMPAALASQPRWRYWRARAVAAEDGAEQATPLYAELAQLRDYYGYLAADRLHRPYELNEHPAPDDRAMQATLAAEPALIRAHALFDCDQAEDAAAEWASAIANTKSAVKVQAARLAAHWGWYSQSIITLAQAGEWDDVPLRYPRPFAAELAQASKLASLPADWILAVMRQESLFRKDAVSHAEARGLMQMQPSTAVAVARRWHWPKPGPDDLFDPAISLRLGAAYLRELLDHYQGRVELALAAYNAGPTAVAHWLPRQPQDADVWVENIPYAETRGYVLHVLEHLVAFAKVNDAAPPRLADLMVRIDPDAAKGP